MISRPLLILLCGCTLAGPVAAGSLVPDAPPEYGSAMYTLEDLYNRLNDGTPGYQHTPFVEPTAGPSGTMHTLNDIMAKMPRQTTNGATAADVLTGTAFWGLKTGGVWGEQMGAMPIVHQNYYLPGTSDQNIGKGYHNGTEVVVGDPDLVSANIKSGIRIFEVPGTYSGGGQPVFPLAKTGQIITIRDRDDGAMQVGVAWPTPRFSDNGNGTVTDNLTGLVWLGQAGSGFGTWATAMHWAAQRASGSSGLTDGSVVGQWRLPTIKELSSLVNAGANSPALPAGHPFTGVQSNWYWSSTSFSTYAWVVDLKDGNVASTSKTSNFFVWSVRGGQ